MARTLNIAVLECDNSIDPVKEKESSKRIWSRDWVSKYNVVEELKYPDPDEVDALLLTGSKHNSFDNDEWILKLVDYTRKVLTEHSTKIVGICFGHQIIARAMGAKVGRNDDGWELSCTNFDLTEKGEELFGKSSLSLHQMHRDIVMTMPEGYVNLGSSKVCKIQGLYKPGQVISLQAHPEYNGDIISQIVDFRHGMGIFDDLTWKDALSRSELDYDEKAASTAICKFLINK